MKKIIREIGRYVSRALRRDILQLSVPLDTVVLIPEGGNRSEPISSGIMSLGDRNIHKIPRQIPIQYHKLHIAWIQIKTLYEIQQFDIYNHRTL